MRSQNLGVQLYLKGGTPSATTYTSAKGTVVTLNDVNNLLGASYLRGTSFYASAGEQVLLEIKLRFVTATSITLKLEEQPLDTDTTLWPNTLWGALQLTAQDNAAAWTGTTYTPSATTTGCELTFTPLAAAGPGLIIAMTTSARITGLLSLSAKANAGGLNTNDFIVVKVTA